MHKARSFFCVAAGVCLLAAPAGSALATGLDLGWNNCPAGAGYSSNEEFACNTNIGTHTLVGSFVAGCCL